MSGELKAARIATAAYLEVRNASNKNYRDGACTYGELKAAVNNAGYVMDEVRRLAGLEPWALADDTMTPTPVEPEEETRA